MRLLRFLIPLAVAAAVLLALSGSALGHNTWNGGYRKWPWKADEARYITTLPNTPPHNEEFNQLAMDVGMSYEKVYSLSPGTYYEFVDRDCLGWTLKITDNDGTYLLYAHLNSSLVSPGSTPVAGMPIAVSGNSGSEDNIPGPGGRVCSSGPHLHFARYSAPPTHTISDRNLQLSLEPISGHGQPIDTLQEGLAYTGTTPA